MWINEGIDVDYADAWNKSGHRATEESYVPVACLADLFT